jgi:glycerophosphoryl diester phosphodiesterase
MLIIGHRGSAGTSPENTLASFEEAIQAGADAVEFDVQVCATGELVIIHDRKVDRTTDGTGLVSQLSYDGLRRLDAGRGEKIPDLEETLELIDNRVEVHIELKSAGTSEKTAKLVNRFISSGKYSAGSFVISSFNHRELINFKKFNNLCRCAALIGHTPLNYARPFHDLDVWSLNVDIDNCSPGFVRSAHALGYKFLVYTVNDIEDRDRLAAMGVDGVFTNFPAIFCRDRKKP